MSLLRELHTTALVNYIYGSNIFNLEGNILPIQSCTMQFTKTNCVVAVNQK